MWCVPADRDKTATCDKWSKMSSIVVLFRALPIMMDDRQARDATIARTLRARIEKESDVEWETAWRRCPCACVCTCLDGRTTARADRSTAAPEVPRGIGATVPPSSSATSSRTSVAPKVVFLLQSRQRRCQGTASRCFQQ